MSDHRLLEHLLGRVADRDPIDWTAVESTLRESPEQSPEARSELEMLRLLDEIGDVHARLQSGTLGDPSSGRISASNDPADDETLTEWGRYRLDEKVGRGGFGSVYRGWDRDLEMPVAIKILHRRFSAAALRERLLFEGRALAQVSHPNVVRVLNVEQNDDRLGLVMELLRGETLETRIASQGVMNDREAALIAEDVCRALIAVHAVKLIHRDVKARNVMRDRSGRIVLMDFGAGSRQGTGRVTEGTPLYMAPELLDGQPASAASDVYSVGVLLFFLVTGRHPFEADTIDGLRAAHTREGAEGLLGRRPDLPRSFAVVVERALARDPSSRYPTPAALLRALGELRDTRPGWRRAASWTTATAAAAALLVTLAGMLSAAAFNATLKRTAYASDSIGVWVELGGRSLVLPLLLSCLSVGGLGLAAAMRSVVVAAFPRVREWDRAIARRCDQAATRVSLRDPHVAPCWVVLLTALGVAGAWWYGGPLLRAMSSDIGRAPSETLSVLSPGLVGYRTSYRMGLSILAAANLAGMYALRRSALARGMRLPRWFIATEIALLVLLCGSLELPYRFAREPGMFPIVEWSSQRCYVLGEHDDEALLFCPSLYPRDRRVNRSIENIARVSDSDESIFSSFDPIKPAAH